MNNVILLAIDHGVLGGSTVTFDRANTRKDRLVVFEFLP